MAPPSKADITWKWPAIFKNLKSENLNFTIYQVIANQNFEEKIWIVLAMVSQSQIIEADSFLWSKMVHC